MGNHGHAVEGSQSPEPELPPLPVEKEFLGKVTPGSSAATLLKPWLSAAEILDLAKACKSHYPLTKIRIGKPWRVITLDGVFSRFEYTMNANAYLCAEKDEEGFHVEVKPFAYDVEEVLVSGQVESSFYAAVQKAGESPMLAVELGNLLGWEIDFVRDLRVGDTFSLLVEKRYAKGEFKGYGDILAAEFTNRGKVIDAYRMVCEGGKVDYYSSDGRNLRHAFLRSPVAFTRISSGYTSKRWHPILKKYRPHYAVDYAAPTGTPIYAIGSGTIKIAGTNRGNGKHIFISHANGYQSGYLHMSRFAKGMRRGKKVTQGQLIGYVGQTGLATGPHLCFRMKQWGKPVNPAKLKVAREKAIPEKEREAFSALVARLRPLLRPGLAKAESPESESPSKG